MPAREQHRAPALEPVAGSATGPGRSRRVLGPAVALLAVAVVFVVGHMNQGVDTYLALAAGAHFRAHGVTLTDPFSFASRRPVAVAGEAVAEPAADSGSFVHPIGWVDQNWLAQTAMTWLVETVGWDALAALKLVLYGLVAAGLVAGGRARGASTLTSIVVAALTLVVCRDYVEIRPADLTNLAVTLLGLVLTLGSRRDSRLYWLLVPLVAVWCNLHSGFVFALMVVVGYGVGHLALGLVGGRAFRLPALALRRLGLAMAGALAATVVASPYRLANLTHVFTVTVGADAELWRSVSEWRPVWAAGLALGNPLPFVVLAAITTLVVVVWLVVGSRHPRGTVETTGFPPDIVLAAAVEVGFLMALASRRMIPVAALFAAPLLAEALEALTARPLSRATARLSGRGRQALELGAWLVVVVLGLVTTRKAWDVYARPWPADPARTSVTDRLLHSYLRPWGACDFLTENAVGGRVWSFWKSAGFLNWRLISGRSQDARLRTFIDGRAQQAFEAEVLRTYLGIVEGGPVGRAATAQGRKLTPEEARHVADQVGRQLRELRLELAVIEAGDASSAVARVLASLPSWELVYTDGRGTVLADTQGPHGKALVELVDSGRAHFPDELSRQLTRASRALQSGSERATEDALSALEAAFAARPSQRAVALASQLVGAPASRARVLAFCRHVAEDFAAHRATWAEQHGYYERVASSSVALAVLRDEALRTGDGATHRWAAEQLDVCSREIRRLAAQVMW